MDFRVYFIGRNYGKMARLAQEREYAMLGRGVGVV
jgi:hypothetical protein